MRYLRIERGRRVCRAQEHVEDDWFYFCQGGAEAHAVALTREFFVEHQESGLVRPGDRWIVVVHPLSRRWAPPDKKLCEVRVWVPTPEEVVWGADIRERTA
ncbi:hypothetical protein ACFFR8_20915 [Streptoalloteichus tenebrarius]